MQKEKRIPNNPKPEESVILSSLASELFQRPSEFPEVTDWDAVLSESIKQAVFPLVFNTVRDRLPDDVKRKWETIFLQNVATNIRVTAAHTDLHKVLTEHDLPYVILKGVASSKYYPCPELRMMGDVDFLVDSSDLERCGTALVDHGIMRKDDGTHKYHRTYSRRSIEYELHWVVPGTPAVGGEKIQKYCSDIIQEAVRFSGLSGDCIVPSDFHHGLILLLHTAAHLTTEGIGLRHLCDWAVFSEKLSEEDFCEAFEKCLKEIGLWKLARVLTMMSAKYLGATPKQWAAGVEDALLVSLMDDIWNGGNFGEKDPQRKAHSVLMIDAETHRIENRGSLRALAAAVDRKAKLYHPSLANSVILRPLAWTAVCWRYSRLTIQGKRPWMTFGRDEKIAKQRKELFSELELFEV